MRRLQIVSAASILFVFSANAADLIESGDYRQATTRTTFYATSYNYEVCNDLILDYRAPHEPRRDLVRVCHYPALPGEWTQP